MKCMTTMLYYDCYPIKISTLMTKQLQILLRLVGEIISTQILAGRYHKHSHKLMAKKLNISIE